MTQENVLLTLPYCFMSDVFVLVAVVTLTTFFCSYWEVSLAKSTSHWNYRRTSRSPVRDVVTNELFGQSSAKILDGLYRKVSVLATENVGICDHKVKHEPEYVLVVFTAF